MAQDGGFRNAVLRFFALSFFIFPDPCAATVGAAGLNFGVIDERDLATLSH
jgi:hypothetical protein